MSNNTENKKTRPLGEIIAEMRASHRIACRQFQPDGNPNRCSYCNGTQVDHLIVGWADELAALESTPQNNLESELSLVKEELYKRDLKLTEALATIERIKTQILDFEVQTILSSQTDQLSQKPEGAKESKE